MKLDLAAEESYFYDITSSYFEGGKEKMINSFHIKYTIDGTALKKQGYLDGVSCFLTKSQFLKPENVCTWFKS